MRIFSLFQGCHQYVRGNIPAYGDLSSVEKKGYRAVKRHSGNLFDDLPDAETKSFKSCGATIERMRCRSLSLGGNDLHDTGGCSVRQVAERDDRITLIFLGLP